MQRHEIRQSTRISRIFCHGSEFSRNRRRVVREALGKLAQLTREPFHLRPSRERVDMSLNLASKIGRFAADTHEMKASQALKQHRVIRSSELDHLYNSRERADGI